MHPSIFFDSSQFAIGIVKAVSGNSAVCELDVHIINLLKEHEDASIARCGAPGSILSIEVEGKCLLANLREIGLNVADELLLTATIDFLGEGDN